MSTTFKVRRDTAANWTTANPTLASGEPGYETDTRKIKYGDGTTAWATLPYSIAASATVTTSLVCDVAVVVGAPLAIDRTTGHFVKADASIYARSFVVGLAVAATAATFVADASTSGAVTLSNWTALAGTTTLSAGQIYFLAVGGGITLTRPTTVGQAVAIVGEATSSTTLSLRLSQPILL